MRATFDLALPANSVIVLGATKLHSNLYYPDMYMISTGFTGKTCKLNLDGIPTDQEVIEFSKRIQINERGVEQ